MSNKKTKEIYHFWKTMSVVFFKDKFYKDWGYRITTIDDDNDAKSIRTAFGFKTKKSALRDYHDLKKRHFI